MSLVITNAQEEDDPSLSPREDGEYISSCTIEGKEADCKSSESLLYQLFANMVLNCVTNFKNKCCNGEYDEVSIRNVKQLSGYGIVYTGMGHIGFYKLQIKFGCL